MTDISSSRLGISHARNRKPADPAVNAAGDPLAELARLIGHYESSGAIVRPDGREECTQKVSPRTFDSTSLQGRQDEPQREQGRSAEDRYAPMAAPLAGPTSPPGAGSNAEEGWADDEFASDELQPDASQAYLSGLPSPRRGLRLLVAIIGLMAAASAGTVTYRLWLASGKGKGAPVTAEVISQKSAADGSTSSNPIDARVNGQGSETPEPVVPRDARAPVTPVFPFAGSVAPTATGPSDESPISKAALADARKALTDKILTAQSSSADSGSTGSFSAVTPPAAARPDAAAAAPPVLATRSVPEPSQPPPAASRTPAGGYVVQLSSQRSEAAAQATARSLKTKYASILGGRQPFVRRSDFGDRGGVYYRAQVGPFAGFTEAKELCRSLKKAGGDCVVLKN